MHKVYKWFILSFTFMWTHSSPPFQNLKGCRLRSCCIPSQPILPAAPRDCISRRDASQKYYIGYRYVAQSDKGPERVPLTRSFLVAMESRPAFIFTAKYFDDSTARRTFSSEDEIVAVVLIRSLLSEREGILKMIATTRNSSRAFSGWGSRWSWHRLAIWTTWSTNDPVSFNIVIISNCFL